MNVKFFLCETNLNSALRVSPSLNLPIGGLQAVKAARWSWDKSFRKFIISAFSMNFFSMMPQIQFIIIKTRQDMIYS